MACYWGALQSIQMLCFMYMALCRYISFSWRGTSFDSHRGVLERPFLAMVVILGGFQFVLPGNLSKKYRKYYGFSYFLWIPYFGRMWNAFSGSGWYCLQWGFVGVRRILGPWLQLGSPIGAHGCASPKLSTYAAQVEAQVVPQAPKKQHPEVCWFRIWKNACQISQEYSGTTRFPTWSLSMLITYPSNPSTRTEYVG